MEIYYFIRLALIHIHVILAISGTTSDTMNKQLYFVLVLK